MFHLGANPDLLPNIEEQLEGGNVSEAVEHEKRELANCYSAEQLCRRVRVLRPRVHRGVHVPVATVGQRLNFLFSTFLTGADSQGTGSNPYFYLPEQGEGENHTLAPELDHPQAFSAVCSQRQATGTLGAFCASVPSTLK